MGLCIALQTESGERLGFVADEKNLLVRLLGTPDWNTNPMLASIDRYGDTVFNQVQMDHFIAEWNSLFERAIDPDENALLSAVLDLAEQSKLGVHRYLTFFGD